MLKKSISAVGILLITAIIIGPVGVPQGMIYAHGHKHKHAECRDCGHYICPGDCGRCEECLARRRAAKEESEKCKKCDHADCLGDCAKCVDCLNERIKKLERALQEKEKKSE
ncbi:MAG: hypothetical protein MRJ65_05205 [Candidatus Brocadiaceae bacterium]|nr:hypothetical protein [Candidatus Brocadiaceae bacterium]